MKISRPRRTYFANVHKSAKIGDSRFSRLFQMTFPGGRACIIYTGIEPSSSLYQLAKISDDTSFQHHSRTRRKQPHSKCVRPSNESREHQGRRLKFYHTQDPCRRAHVCRNLRSNVHSFVNSKICMIVFNFKMGQGQM